MKSSYLGVPLEIIPTIPDPNFSILAGQTLARRKTEHNANYPRVGKLQYEIKADTCTSFLHHKLDKLVILQKSASSVRW